MKRVYCIAEAGLNHNGDVEIAKKMIDVAIECKADAVKFQKRDVDQMATKDVLDKPFTNFPSFGSTYREVREHLELTKSEYKELRDYCRGKIEFLVTPFDIQSLEFLDDLNIDGIKIAAHSLTDIPLLEEIGKRDAPIYLSTGMSTLEDIRLAVKTLDSEKKLYILHCVSQYPMDVQFANLPMINKLKEIFPNYEIGWSDHQNGISLASAATALGVSVIEKHFTLDRVMEGFDHAMSLEPLGLKKCIRDVRIVERAMKYYPKKPMPNEMECFNAYRRTIVSKVQIPKGTIITRDMLTTKAPNIGLSPKLILDVLGKKAKIDIKEDEHITFYMIE
jgi:sialic acid synthase SpsE